MASLPPSQRRVSPPKRTSDQQPTRSLSVESSTISEDSQTVLLNHPSTSQSSPELSLLLEDSQKQDDRPSPPKRKDTNDLKKCWICFADESEDTPMSSEWRSPCPCALTAHEACLLDWIADIEAPGKRRGTSRIECPQCKSEIIVARPRSYVVDAVRSIDNACARVVWPGVLVIGVSSVWRLCYEYGILTVEVVFGTQDATRILSPLFQPPSASEGAWESVGRYVRETWRIHTGLTLVPPMLILSRTSIADGILPILPMLFFATSPARDPLEDFNVWPPSAAVSFAVLPYIRSAYNFYYEHVWGEKERRWMKEIRPRSTTTSEGDANQDAAEELDEDGFDLEINMAVQDIIEEEEPHRNVPNGPAPPLHAPPFDRPAPAPNAQANAQPAPNGPVEHRHERQIHLSPTRIADTVLGALAFPIISALMGDILRLTLPKAWTTPATTSWGTFMRITPQKGFLQNRWARSIVGGAAFVVLKDAVMLYVKWKMAQQHRRRRVCEFDKRTKKVVYPRGSEV